MLPREFEPRAGDDEVENFELWPIAQVIHSLADLDDRRWKPNVAVVVIDMLIRKGLVRPEAEGYAEILRALRS